MILLSGRWSCAECEQALWRPKCNTPRDEGSDSGTSILTACPADPWSDSDHLLGLGWTRDESGGAFRATKPEVAS